MGRGSQELDAARELYVCVRITDMSQVDLNIFELDFDLTFAAVLMHADGTICHRYGGRAPASPNAFLSLRSLSRLLRDTLPEHRAHDDNPKPPQPRAARPASELPVLQRKIQNGQRLDCVHGHTINDAQHVDAMLQGHWQKQDLYVFPDPQRIGLSLDHEQQNRILTVQPGSAASKAGLAAGDQLLSLGMQQSVRTLSDVQWALHRAPFGDTTLPIRAQRGERTIASELHLVVG